MEEVAEKWDLQTLEEAHFILDKKADRENSIMSAAQNNAGNVINIARKGRTHGR